MMTIYKYPIALSAGQVLRIPKGAEPLSVQMQDGNICMWARVDTSQPLRDFEIAIYGTGHELPDKNGERLMHLGTVQRGAFVWHIFEVL